MAWTLILYKNTSDNRKLNKAIEVRKKYTEGIHLKEGCSFVNPVFRITKTRDSDGDIISVGTLNYFYVEEWHRYYFITDIVFGVGGVMEIHGHCDVLMSFKDKLLAKEFFITRNENTYDSRQIDETISIDKGTQIQKINVGVVGDTDTYYLTVNGGV